MFEKSKWITDEQVEAEIERLQKSEAVSLARLDARIKYRRRQVLYNLRDLEKKGKALMASGITKEILYATYNETEKKYEDA